MVFSGAVRQDQLQQDADFQHETNEALLSSRTTKAAT